MRTSHFTALFKSLWKTNFEKSHLGDSRVRTPGAAEYAGNVTSRTLPLHSLHSACRMVPQQ